jgi:hypothetical protein
VFTGSPAWEVEGFYAHRPAERCTAPSSLGLVAQGGVWGRPVGEPTVTFSAQPANQDHLT